MKQNKARQLRKHEVTLPDLIMCDCALTNHQLFHARLRTVESVGLQQHAALFDRLNPQNMSGDEQDGQVFPLRYRIIESRWQSSQLKTFLRELDAIHLKDRGLSESVHLSGQLPRVRVVAEDSPVEDGYPAVGLWRNCYDSDWLQALQRSQRDTLGVIDEDYDFALPVAVDDGTVDTA